MSLSVNTDTAPGSFVSVIGRRVPVTVRVSTSSVSLERSSEKAEVEVIHVRIAAAVAVLVKAACSKDNSIINNSLLCAPPEHMIKRKHRTLIDSAGAVKHRPVSGLSRHLLIV
jgi:hypothetical protein